MWLTLLRKYPKVSLFYSICRWPTKPPTQLLIHKWKKLFQCPKMICHKKRTSSNICMSVKSKAERMCLLLKTSVQLFKTGIGLSKLIIWEEYSLPWTKGWGKWGDAGQRVHSISYTDGEVLELYWTAWWLQLIILHWIFEIF